MIDVLQEQLKQVREGNIRSVAVVSVAADGASIGTHWSGKPEDLASLISDPSFEDKALRFATDAACQVVYITKQRYLDSQDDGEAAPRAR